jgi:hypothetical protein
MLQILIGMMAAKTHRLLFVLVDDTIYVVDWSHDFVCDVCCGRLRDFEIGDSVTSDEFDGVGDVFVKFAKV